VAIQVPVLFPLWLNQYRVKAVYLGRDTHAGKTIRELVTLLEIGSSVYCYI